MHVQVNLWAVLLATLSSMIIGYFWYAPKGFGGTWMKLAKIDPKKFNTGLAMGSAVVSSFVMAYALAYVASVFNQFFQNSFLTDVLWVGFIVFFGFQGIRMFQRAQFNQNTHTETAIHIGNEFVTVLAMVVIIGFFGN